MATFTSRDGEAIDIERNDDGSYTVTGEHGESATYGENSAEHIANDWDIDFDSIQNDPMFEPYEPGEPDNPEEPEELDPGYESGDDPGYTG